MMEWRPDNLVRAYPGVRGAGPGGLVGLGSRTVDSGPAAGEVCLLDPIRGRREG